MENRSQQEIRKEEERERWTQGATKVEKLGEEIRPRVRVTNPSKN
jgi:hypothetical protein